MYAKLGDIYSFGSGKIIKPQSIDQIVDDIKHRYLNKKVYLVQEAGKFEDELTFLKFVKRNRTKVENGDGFTRYLILMGNGENAKTITNDEPESDDKKKKKGKKSEEVETLNTNVSIIQQAREEHKHQALESVAEASVIEYFYLESPHIPEKFFPIKIYGIFDRVTIEEAKIGRLKDDIIKILSLTKKFGVYEGLESKQDDDNEVSKNLDKEVFTVANSIRRFTDKNYDPDYDISYPEFTTQHFSPNRAEGACQHCHGLGEILQVDMDRIIDR